MFPTVVLRLLDSSIEDLAKGLRFCEGRVHSKNEVRSVVQTFCRGIIDTLKPSLKSHPKTKDALWVKTAKLTLEAYRRPDRVA